MRVEYLINTISSIYRTSRMEYVRRSYDFRKDFNSLGSIKYEFFDRLWISYWGLTESCRACRDDSGDIKNIQNKDRIWKLRFFEVYKKILCRAMTWHHQEMPHVERPTLPRDMVTWHHENETCGATKWGHLVDSRSNDADEQHDNMWRSNKGATSSEGGDAPITCVWSNPPLKPIYFSVFFPIWSHQSSKISLGYFLPLSKIFLSL